MCFSLRRTAPEAEAESLAEKIVSSQLAACVNIVPAVTSVYTWKGKVEKDKEVLLMVKTRTTLRKQLVDFVKKTHSYDTPEVIFVSINGGNPAYLEWLLESTARPPA